MTNRLEANYLTPCATLLVFYFGRETVYKITLGFIVISINSTSQYGSVPYDLNHQTHGIISFSKVLVAGLSNSS